MQMFPANCRKTDAPPILSGEGGKFPPDFLGDPLHLLRTAPRADEDGIPAAHDDQVLHPDDRDEASVRSGEDVAAVRQDDVSGRDVFPRLPKELVQGPPGPEIAPAEARRDDENPLL